ncbi:hypothetical protein A3B21_03270 [Candidatus Uhrbacteria bacterium RIFCSPLOWO2_01_FULL_47_24]|uniref:Lipoprotein n=1 Tax=Candidatus Uhrbacteria bacterium RIFCSPLOWO2_01_FULL_47_24 TaxID=1802401 RepID=A0A1F7URP5_9BACT|nr:MAG: hypothetical protein A3D58_03870 [Candidatus Uhrbacteria bacterium RIFCSPHIGHO2_02_FULL_46_47]OGL80961.1 MAG: hypothetical protein A3B21_03270 [Candidatus Uhrbacteria bacterium RIFCSPLOWO2_01_FULL_47_24]OGL84296.1 MAG: hypothetical protein A3J03_03270 [Candidatus Uhrbacteria bacterium RIFCSPLOWO2_02_FULL_46_25]OGL93306.1 MAG: hypothetical protein A3H11_03035 [Candidatus Uhrbacteria bacterium RIFCSPLOWO2_12_FULL_47_10]
MKKIFFPLAIIMLLGAGCLRATPQPPTPTGPTIPSLPSSQPTKQDFPDRLDEGLNDLKLLEDIK